MFFLSKQIVKRLAKNFYQQIVYVKDSLPHSKKRKFGAVIANPHWVL